MAGTTTPFDNSRDRLLGILHGFLKTNTTYDELTAGPTSQDAAGDARRVRLEVLGSRTWKPSPNDSGE